MFGRCDWALMFVLARGGQTYARLRFSAGPGGEMELPVRVDWSQPFPAADHAAWEAEYTTNIRMSRLHGDEPRLAGSRDWFDGLTEFEVAPCRRQDHRDQVDPAAAEELDAWGELILSVDADELDAAAGKLAARWGLPDSQEWTESVLSLPPDRQREFRREIEAMLPSGADLIDPCG